MRKIILLAALALAAGALAQEQKKEETRPAAEDKPKPAAVAKKPSPKRHQDARHCLEKASNTEIIRCAEAYL